VLIQALCATDLIEEYDFITREAGQVLNAVGSYLHDRARYAEAEPLYERALRIWEQGLSPDHPWVASALHGLANLYVEQGKDAEAELLYERALPLGAPLLAMADFAMATIAT
jgi:Tfp pilus assembly protein PilF